MRKTACTMLLSVALAGCAGDNTAPVPPKSATIKVIGFNDFHGALNPTGTAHQPHRTSRQQRHQPRLGGLHRR